jgi:hypothetical protein
MVNFDGSESGPSSWGGSRHKEAAADARQIVQVIWALPGDSAFRRNSADIVVRYLGGDLALLDEIIGIRATQETLDSRHPARFLEKRTATANDTPPSLCTI